VRITLPLSEIAVQECVLGLNTKVLADALLESKTPERNKEAEPIINLERWLVSSMFFPII
jgi:hypothetical protein